jgi:hypothetical protein
MLLNRIDNVLLGLAVRLREQGNEFSGLPRMF